MGTFRIQVELENPARPGVRRAIGGLLVDTGSELSWVPAGELEALGVPRSRRMRFRQATGQVIERWVGIAVVHVGGIATGDDVVFGEPDDLVLLGSRTLEGLNVTIDPVSKSLIDAGPAPVAMADRHSRRSTVMTAALAAIVAAHTLGALPAAAHAQQSVGDWPIHSTDRPHPPIVAPGKAALPVPPPADAIVLFDGHDLSKWQSDSGAPARWHLVEGQAMEVAPGTGTLTTRDGFGDVQLHVEWASPKPARGKDQDRGNSGVFLMGRYEVQVLDSYDNVTYADGQAAAVYGQYPPLANVSRRPGEWQSYDIVWHRPRFGSLGGLESPARLTVFHNGVLVQDNVVLTGPTGHHVRPPYEVHADRLPIALQDHGHKVRFRNLWLRDLEARR